MGTYGGPVLVILWTLFPVLWILSLSFKPESGINNEKFLPDTFTLENYRTVFKTPLFTSALRNSIFISLIATLLSVMIATVAAQINLVMLGSELTRGPVLDRASAEQAVDTDDLAAELAGLVSRKKNYATGLLGVAFKHLWSRLLSLQTSLGCPAAASPRT